jgi:uncharacterized circularly permuted ATP-grasp superfamily protein
MLATGPVLPACEDLPFLEAYDPPQGFFDEMFAPPNRAPRQGCGPVAKSLFQITPTELLSLRAQAERMLLRMGVTFNVYGDEAGTERIFPFDVIPRIIDAQTWRMLEAGLIQRIQALNAFVADVYTDGHILEDGVIPRDLILESSQYRRGAVGIKPPRGVFITVAGIDLARDHEGRFCVLEDNVRTPSGVSYVMQNRQVMVRLLPRIMRDCRVRSVENYPAELLTSLMELAPEDVSHPTVALLTPGPYNSAFFEHAFLSQQMGIELVEGRDLLCVDDKLWMKTLRGLQRIDVLYRRIDDDFLDPVVFRPDSVLGVAGLTAVMRAGSVALANGIGTGVADDKAVFAYTPAMIQYYLGEKPILPVVETYLLRDRETREMVLRDLDRYVIKPTGASGGYGVVIGPRASDRELAEVRKRIECDPSNYIAQPMVKLSVHPTLVNDAHGSLTLAARHVDLRPFVLLGARPRVMSGGLTRVALRDGSLIVNSSQGGGSKDTWVLGA